MTERIEIEKLENGFSVTVWKESEEEGGNDFGYSEPKKFVAKTKEEAMKIFNENFGDK